MQGKDLSHATADPGSKAGVDVSKRWLDAHVLPADQHRRFANTPAGIRQLTRWLRRFPVGLVAVEATGKWHRALCRSLAAQGVPAAVTDPYRVRAFAKASGILAKTDRLDARVLALFAATMAPDPRPPAAPVFEALQELVRARASAIAAKTAIENQRADAQDPFLKRQLARRCARSEKDIAALETEIGRRIAADPALARRHAILLSIPGIGPVVAALLVAWLPELGAASAKQITLLVGLAPIPDDSGERNGQRHIKGGRRIVRDGLYLAALSAARYNPALKAFHRHLTDQGKAAKVALIAVARKLLLLANALVTQDREWHPAPPNHA